MEQGRETILLVDDEVEIRSLVREMLEPEGYTILEAGGGEEALRCAQETPGAIHLLLTDVMMPGMSGVQLLDRLQRLRPAIKVLYMSGFTTETVVDCGMRPSDPFIAKPFPRAALSQKVREVLDYRSPFTRRPASGA